MEISEHLEQIVKSIQEPFEVADIVRLYRLESGKVHGAYMERTANEVLLKLLHRGEVIMIGRDGWPISYANVKRSANTYPVTHESKESLAYLAKWDVIIACSALWQCTRQR